MQRTLVIMAKAPVLGRVKTRLAREVGAVEAARFYRVALARLLARLGPDPRWLTVVAVAPDTAHWPAPPWVRDADAVVAQGDGDLGARMQRVFDTAPPGPCVIVGSDIPAIRAAHVAQAFHALGSHDAAMGPTPDGGYWLIGQKRVPRVRRCFAGVEWSSGREGAQTRANLAGARLALLPTLPDVDTGADHARWRAGQG